MGRIVVDFSAISDLEQGMLRRIDDCEELLRSLRRQLQPVQQQWTGAASDKFQETVRQWNAVANDLMESLNKLRGIVRTAHNNYRSAVDTNTRMWKGVH